jgi:hypothetical protein
VDLFNSEWSTINQEELSKTESIYVKGQPISPSLLSECVRVISKGLKFEILNEFLFVFIIIIIVIFLLYLYSVTIQILKQ